MSELANFQPSNGKIWASSMHAFPCFDRCEFFWVSSSFIHIIQNNLEVDPKKKKLKEKFSRTLMGVYV